MPRKKKAPVRKSRQRVPRTRAGGTWTESQYWSFIRSGLRYKSSRYPPIFQVKQANRKTVKGKRHKYEYKCAECEGWYKEKDVSVDHIVPCGSLRKYDDLPGFVERLFCEPKDLQILCRKCHKEKTARERMK